MQIPAFQNYHFIGFAILIVVLLTAEDQGIIADMRETIMAEPNNDLIDIRGELEEKIRRFGSASGDTFQPLAVALAHIRNARLQSPHFVSLI